MTEFGIFTHNSPEGSVKGSPFFSNFLAFPFSLNSPTHSSPGLVVGGIEELFKTVAAFVGAASSCALDSVSGFTIVAGSADLVVGVSEETTPIGSTEPASKDPCACGYGFSTKVGSSDCIDGITTKSLGGVAIAYVSSMCTVASSFCCRSRMGFVSEPALSAASRSHFTGEELAGDRGACCLLSPENWVEEEGEDEGALPDEEGLGFFFLVMMKGREDGGMGAGFQRRERRRR